MNKSIVYLEHPVNLYELRKTYADSVEFVTDTANYPNIIAIRYDGQLNKAIKGKLTAKNVKDKADRLLELYKRKLFRYWDDHADTLVDKIASLEITKGGPGSGCKGPDCGRPKGITNLQLDLLEVRPAITYQGHTYTGIQGDIHNDIFARELSHLPEFEGQTVYTTTDKVGTGFTDKDGSWLPRHLAREKYGVSESFDLAAKQNNIDEKYSLPTIVYKLEKADEMPSEEEKKEDEDTKKKRAIIAGLLATMGFALADSALDFYKRAYILGKERGVSISGQDFIRALNDKEIQRLTGLTEKNKAHLDKFMKDLEDKYVGALQREYRSQEAMEAEIRRITQKHEARLAMYAFAALGALALGFTQGVREGRETATEEAKPGEMIPTEITGMIWVTNHDDAVCPGCADNDGKFFTDDEFEAEYQSNECLVRCRCAETSVPTDRPASHFGKSLKFSLLQKGGPGSGCQGSTCGRPKGSVQLQDVRPAIKVNGKVLVGKKGQLHADLMEEHGLLDMYNDLDDPRIAGFETGFVNNEEESKWLSREELAHTLNNTHVFTTSEDLSWEQQSNNPLVYLNKCIQQLDTHPLLKGGPGSGCNPDEGTCGRPKGSGNSTADEASLTPLSRIRSAPQQAKKFSPKQEAELSVIANKEIGGYHGWGTPSPDSPNYIDIHNPKTPEIKAKIETLKQKLILRDLHIGARNELRRIEKALSQATPFYDRAGTAGGEVHDPNINIIDTPDVTPAQVRAFNPLIVMDPKDVIAPKKNELSQRATRISIEGETVLIPHDTFRGYVESSIKNFPPHLQDIISRGLTHVSVAQLDSETTAASYSAPLANVETLDGSHSRPVFFGKTIRVNRTTKGEIKKHLNFDVLLTHELSHALDHSFRLPEDGTVTPTPAMPHEVVNENIFSHSRAWKDAMKGGRPITGYSRRNSRENFAESVTAYIFVPDKLKEANPKAYEVIDMLWKGKHAELNLKKNFEEDQEGQLDNTEDKELPIPEEHEIDDLDGSIVEFISEALTKKNQVQKGGPGSGSWEAPGDPRFAHVPVSSDAPQEGGPSASTEEEKPEVASGKVNPSGATSKEQHTTPSGEYSKERQALHNKIKQPFFAGKTPVPKPVAYLMGGGPASGKSSLLEGGLLGIPDNTVRVDSDKIKAVTPEYQQMLAKGDSNAAAFVHGESSDVSMDIAHDATQGSYNVLLDGTGDSDIDKLERKVNILRAKGAEVIANYASVNVDVAIARNIARAEKTGRYVPESVIRKTYGALSHTVLQALDRGLYDKFTLWDTSAAPKPIASLVDKKLVIHDQAQWKAFASSGDVK